MKSFAVIRADSSSKVNIALRDLVRYGHMSFDDSPKQMDPRKADNVLVDVMHTNLKSPCGSAAVVPLGDHASSAIGRLKKIHPPAHVIIVSPQHSIFSKLASDIDKLPEMDLHSQDDDDEDFD
ncbi:MAG: DUF356 domain-containing protein [Methanosarcinales archaeon]|nr:DUF356 domain-containing protein [ANME-2 cluster archaeon]MDF1531237.1 DUF356 domain-containing protein [ANME-2 cluster archaeon]MDW7776095.1 DUF356 domain-containing protein [Methanosarcinales archaeon]